MPFKSKKQRSFLQINKPALYNRWKKKYGAKINKTKSNK